VDDPSEPIPASGVIDEERPDTDPPGDAPELGEADERARKVRSIVEWGLVIAGALVVALVIKAFVVQAFYIPSGSMEPTLNVGDRVFVNKLSYRAHDVNRGDLVVFERPPHEAASGIKDLIKRVIALEGDTISGQDGKVVVNGRVLEEPYLVDGTVTADLERQTVPDDHVFVMGDNRTNSTDSRSFGAIDEDLIIGRAFIRVWPPSDLSWL
jgi:signal peptidase I